MYRLINILLVLFAGVLFAKANETVKSLGDEGIIITTDDNLPQDFPLLEITKKANGANGYYFIGNYPYDNTDNKYGNYNMIVDNEGKIKAYKRIGEGIDNIPVNFMQSKNGFLKYTEIGNFEPVVFVTDTAMAIKDSIASNKTLRNEPYLMILPNGNYLKVSHEQEYLDLSGIVDGGEPNTLVISSNILEFDRNKNIVFYWRGMDYIDFDDSYFNPVTKVNNGIFNFIKTSNIAMDRDGNLLLCNTNLSEITKVDKKTGDIVWRLGGKNNEFEFIGENEENAPNYFSFQNDIQRLNNGNITLFDNGFRHRTKYSRGVEYELDEINKTCKLVWEYRHEPDIYSRFNGGVQRLGNGNTVISWGDAGLSGDVSMTEIDEDNNILVEMKLPFGYRSSSITKSPWAVSLPTGRANFEILRGNTYNFNKGFQITCTKMTIKELQEIFYPMIFVNKYEFAPLNPEFNEPIPPIVHPVRLFVSVRGLISVEVEARFDLSCLGIHYKPQEWKVYRRDASGSGVFEQVPTNFDENTGELVIQTDKYGEFIFGVTQSVSKPKETWLVLPKNGDMLNDKDVAKLSWSPHGYFTHCNLQIAEDEDFNNIILDTNAIRQIDFNYDNIETGKTYWWRVSSDNGSIKGDWSEAWKFKAVPSFICLTVPNGGEVWKNDSSKKIIRWGKNISDNVKIELFKGGILYHVISDSLFSPTGGYSWVIPDFIPYDSTYKIKVSSLENPELSSQSDNFFAIVDPTTSVINSENINLVLQLEQNTPNPFSVHTTFEFYLPNSGRVNLDVYNIMGEKVANILNQELEKGPHKINWNFSALNAGQYYFRLEFGGQFLTKSMTVVK